MLLTLSPLSGNPFPLCASTLLQRAASYDLHVLGMPPAFILSQDQTLQKIYFVDFIKSGLIKLKLPSYSKLTFCSVFKDQSLVAFLEMRSKYIKLLKISQHFFSLFLTYFFDTLYCQHFFVKSIFYKDISNFHFTYIFITLRVNS